MATALLIVTVEEGTSLVILWVRLCFTMQGVQVQSLTGELGFPHALWAKKTKQKTEAIL